MSASRHALVTVEEEETASSGQRRAGAEGERGNFTNGDVLDLFSNPRTSPAMSRYYGTIRLWHIAVFATAVFSSLVYAHFSLAKAWATFRAPHSWGALGLFSVILLFGSKIKMRDPGTASAFPDLGQWLRRKGWVFAVEPSDGTKALIAARHQYGAVSSTMTTNAAAITRTSASCPEAASPQAEPEPQLLTAAQHQMLRIEPPEFTVLMHLLVVIFALLPLVLEVYTIATTDVDPEEPTETALWRAGTAAASATLAVLISADIVVLQRSKVGIQALLDQELLLRHQASV
ncbi:hypothetical protein BGZ67_009572 [Mortierella alpina]|nr:hypothetical protein BGZ67_009572 [Mortierella alpina]